MTGRTSNVGKPHPLTAVEYDVLVALGDADRHGYGILREIEQRTGRRLRPGTLYRAVDRMLGAAWIEASDDRPDPAEDDQRRRYYRITELGRRIVGFEAQRLAQAVAAARAKNLLEGQR